MFAPSTLKMFITRLLIDDKAHRPAATSRLGAHAAERPRPENGSRLSHASPAAPGLRLGEAVHHGQFGPGRVTAHWPDGTLQVRFEGAARSRLVWPSFLDCADG